MQNDAPVTVVIFGGTGDLAKRKLIPAFFDLHKERCLPDTFSLIGFSRKDLSDTVYQQFVSSSLSDAGRSLEQAFIQQAKYVQGDLSDMDSYKKLAQYLEAHDQRVGTCTNKLIYLAVPPHLYEMVFTNLAKSGLAIPCKEHKEAGTWTRVLVEKPFGNDREHARQLDTLLGKLFKEDQIFRIDHYLAKETVQNILTFRFANTLFEPTWNHESIASVDIAMYESFDIRERAAFYDGIGALRDLGQNHLLQLLALVAMEDPKTMDAEAIRTARADVFKHVTLAKDVTDSVMRGQYVGYTETTGVDPESQTETFFKLHLNVNTKRWKGVPFTVAHGKAMHDTYAEIRVIFKEQPRCTCLVTDDREHSNVVTFRIQPNEGIDVRFWAKRPGFTYELDQKELSFSYSKTIERLPDPYERVLYDAIRGDHTLFTSTKEVKAQWDIIAPIIADWHSLPLIHYDKGATPDTITVNHT